MVSSSERTRQHAVVDGELVREDMSAAGGADRVEVADHVRDGDVGRGELLHVAAVAIDPGDGGIVLRLVQEVLGVA
jgi:hypothetical protein